MKVVLKMFFPIFNNIKILVKEKKLTSRFYITKKTLSTTNLIEFNDKNSLAKQNKI